MAEEAVSVFLSYSRRDLEMLNTLNRHLAGLRRTNQIKTWHDRDIEAGSEWEPAIQRRLNTAEIIILLISAHFIDSDYCYGNELKRAIERHDAGEAQVIPVILKPCLWNLPDIPFSKLNVLPDHALPITKWPDPEEAFTTVALSIANLVEDLRRRKIEQQAEQQKTEELERLRKIEQLAQQAAEAERIRQEELERQRQAQLKQEAEKQRQQELEQQKRSTDNDDLRSERHIDYTQLRDLLKAGKWREADDETTKKMCEVMGRQKEGRLRVKDVEQLPCTDLRTIDRLWVKHSNGKFGFSVQKKIWQECGSPTGHNADWEKFDDRVGRGVQGDWIDDSQVIFDTSEPNGHFPAISFAWDSPLSLVDKVLVFGSMLLPVPLAAASLALSLSNDKSQRLIFVLFSRATICKL